MHVVLEKVLGPEELARITSLIGDETYFDGSTTSTLIGKKNLQLPVESPASRAAGHIVLESLNAHETFLMAVQPLFVMPPLFSRYETGMEYPDHIDYAVMGGRRTDVSITVFLQDPDTYDGGALVVNTGSGQRSYRLNAGDAIAYPSSTLHHVSKVTRGTRLAAVLWVQSMVREAEKRKILYDLGSSVRSLSYTEEPCTALVRQSYWNLIRLWAET